MLLNAILRGMQRHLGSRSDLASDTLDIGPHVDEMEVTLADCKGKRLESLMDEPRDEMTGLVLDKDLGNAMRRTTWRS